MPVDTHHKEYDKHASLWRMCRDASAGEHAVHAAKELYFPKLYREKAEDYMARLQRTPFFGASWRTIAGLKGMIFRQAPVAEIPAGIAAYTQDIDRAGRTLDVFAQHVAEEVLTVGRGGILVDYPPMPMAEDGTVPTVAQAEAMGIRPGLGFYTAESIINWRVSSVNGARVLSLVVLQECIEVDGKTEFDPETATQYRVLDLVGGVYRQRVIVKNEKGEELQVSETFPMMGGRAMNFIPFVFIGTDDLSPEIDLPPLLDLVTMNFHHYRVSGDYEHGCHFSGLPTLFLFGINPDAENPIYIGGPAANCIPNPEGHVEYAQTEGAFDALRTNLDSKKSEMAVLGARMLESQKTAVESGETLKQRGNGENSQLASMAQIISDGIQNALQIMAEWSGAGGEVSYRLNTDYLPAGLTAQELTALVTAWQSGAISQQVLFDNLKRGEVIDSETTFEEEQERIASQGAGNVG